MRRSKSEKLKRRIEAMNLARAVHRQGWSDTLIEQCEAFANRLLPRHLQTDLKASTWSRETPVGFDVTSLSPAVAMCP